jgi:hypothetical protein
MAGKIAHCTCGAIMRIPTEATTTAVDTLPIPSATPVMTGIPSNNRDPERAIDYQGGTKGDTDSPSNNLADDVHDVYLPTALLIIGLLASFGWIVHQGKWGTRESIVIFQLTGAAILIKVAILSFVAWLFARKSGGSFGTPATTILKIAALVIFLDAVFLWLRTGMTESGMMSASGRGPRGTIMLELLVLVFTALFVARFVYRLDDNEATTFGCLIAVGNLMVNVALVLAVAAGLHLLIAARTRSSAMATVPSPANTLASTSSSSTPIADTSADRQIARRISQGSPIVFEGRQWKQVFFLRNSDKPTSNLIDQMYAAGALKVYIDVVGGQTVEGVAAHPTAEMYVELPVEQVQRAKCSNIALAYRSENGVSSAPPFTPVDGRFLVIDLR